MALKIINTNNAPAAIGPYSQAIIAENLIYISGQIPINPETNQMANNIEEQTYQSLTNIKNILIASNSSIENVVRCGVYLKNLEDFPIMNQIYNQFFSTHKPARSTVEVSKLPKNALIEIEAIAVIKT